MASNDPVSPVPWRLIGLGLSLLGVVGCASAPPPVVEPEPEIIKIDRGATSVEGELGGMNEDDVASTFQDLQSPIFACITQGASRVKELGGHFAISLRIDGKGSARWAYLSESTLGDRETERCILEVARNADWPKPLGGDGLAQRSFDVDPTVEPVAWKAEKVRSAMKHLSREVARCTKGKAKGFVATAYVAPGGRVKSAGIAPRNAEGEASADCVATAVQKVRLGSPGRRAAKVTFDL